MVEDQGGDGAEIFLAGTLCQKPGDAVLRAMVAALPAIRDHRENLQSPCKKLAMPARSVKNEGTFAMQR